MPGAWVEEQKKGWEERNSVSTCVFMYASPHLMLFEGYVVLLTL